jgi:hypothetical protein
MKFFQVKSVEKTISLIEDLFQPLTDRMSLHKIFLILT